MNVVKWISQIVLSVGECAVSTILSTEASTVRIVHADTGFVVTEMVSTLGIAGCPVQQSASGRGRKRGRREEGAD